MHHCINLAIGVLNDVWRNIFNPLRRVLIPFLVWRGRLLYPLKQQKTSITRLTRTTLLKSGYNVRLMEAHNMRFIRRNTSIPVPEVLDAWDLPNGGGSSILMKWIEGDTLQSRWSSLNTHEKEKIAGQLKVYAEQLRSLIQPKSILGQVCALDGSCCRDERLHRSNLVGPFLGEYELNEYLLSQLSKYQDPWSQKKIDSIKEGLREDHAIVFTHGDLGGANILIDAHANVVGVIDWEMSGWMPEHWEYLKCRLHEIHMENWELFIKNFLVPYEEVKIDDIWWEINGSWFF